MVDFEKLGKIFLWISCFFLASTLFLFPLYNGISNDNLYAKGYEANDAYERMNYKDVWIITEHTQYFLKEGGELMFFPPDEKDHLLEVQELITLLGFLLAVSIIFFTISLGLTIRFHFQKIFGKLTKSKLVNEMLVFDFRDPAKKKFYLNLFASIFKKSGIIIFILILITGIFASSWDWFFTVFHETFFSGQWMFEPSTLMIQLWDHPFFLVAAKFIALRIVIIAIILFGLSLLVNIFQKKVVL